MRFSFRFLVISIISIIMCGDAFGREVDDGQSYDRSKGTGLLSSKNLNDFVNYKKGRFTKDEIISLCSRIDGRKEYKDVTKEIDQMISRAKISKELWNNLYVHKIKCNSSTVLQHALFNEAKDFIAIADYGANLELEFRDFNGDISTVKDFSIQQFKESSGAKKTKWYKIIKYLKKHKVKGCKELPHLQCTTPDISKVIW